MRDFRAVVLLIVLIFLQDYAAEESVIVISELTVKTERLDEFLEWIHDDLENSRDFSGNLRFDVYVNSLEAGEVLFVEHWESEMAQQHYVQWRARRGDFEQMRAYLSKPPNMVHYRRTEIQTL